MAKKVNQGLIRKDGDTPTPVPTPVPKGGFEVSLILMLGDEELVLNGRSLAGGVKVEYTRPWKEAIELGTFMDGVGLVGNAIGVSTLKEDVQGFIDGLPAFLANVVGAVATAQLILTDLTIDTTGTAVDPSDLIAKNHYILGLGLSFKAPIKVGNVTLKAFLIKYESYKAITA